jgi:hypothetical protein
VPEENDMARRIHNKLAIREYFVGVIRQQKIFWVLPLFQIVHCFDFFRYIVFTMCLRHNVHLGAHLKSEISMIF